MTTPTKEEFWAYEKVRQSGITNMFAVGVVESLSGLSRETIMSIMQSYEACKNMYGDPK